MTAPRAAAAGALAAAAALAAGEVASGLSIRVPSPVLGVAERFVDESPGDLVRWGIRNLGTSQKAILVAGVVAASLALGAAAGLLASRRFALAATVFATFGVAGAIAAAGEEPTSAAGAWIAAAVSTGAGVATLRVLLRRAQPRTAGGASADAAGRRRFLIAGGATAALALAGAGLGRFLRQLHTVEAARERLRAVLGPGGPPSVPAGIATFDGAVPGISPIVTPNRDFYRIDTALLPRQVDPAGWTLRVTGMVDRELELTLDDLIAMERVEDFVTLACVSNEVGGDLVGTALWSGVALDDLLDRAGVRPGATQVVGRSVDGWTAGFPTRVVFDGRGAMVALTMNGEPLPVSHGFPARLVVPGLYGYVSATKWLAELELTTLEAFDAYWVPRGWAKEAPIETQSRIDVPRGGSTLPAGRVPVAGVAWAPTRGIDRVEVRVDDGPWEPARLSGELSGSTWVQWLREWDAAPGAHRIAVRATDGTGATQTDVIAPPEPSGATGHHTVRVRVEERA